MFTFIPEHTNTSRGYIQDRPFDGDWETVKDLEEWLDNRCEEDQTDMYAEIVPCVINDGYVEVIEGEKVPYRYLCEASND